MGDNSNPLTFCNRIRVESVGVFYQSVSKRNVVQFFNWLFVLLMLEVLVKLL